jgi:lysophospholipase L1-like esterase
LQRTTENAVSIDTLFNPIKNNIVWEGGGYNNTIGSPLSDFKHAARKRTGYLSFDTRVNIVSDGVYTVTLSICDADLNLALPRQYTDVYSGDFLCVPPNTTFRLLVWDRTSPTKDISAVTSEEINEHISVYRNGTSYFANPKVRWCAMGDSITQGFVSTGATAPSSPTPAKGWAHKVADMKNWIITNKGVCGSGWIQGGTNPPKPAYTVAEDTDFTQFDLVTLAYGINDWNTGVPLGSVETYDQNTTPDNVSSAICKTLDTIIASNPLCKIFVITPMNCWWRGDENTNWAIGAENAIGVTLEQFTQAIKTVCEYYGVEVIDMTHSSIVNRKNIKSCMLDQVHPTEAAYTAIAHELAAKIRFE